jgi:hypothetical protein
MYFFTFKIADRTKTKMAARSKKQTLIYTLIIVAVFVILSMWLVGKFNDVKQDINPSGYELNRKINERNTNYSKLNPFGFTDRIWPAQKPKGYKRIVVLGDSFIWGDGLPYEDAWGHKFARKVLAKYDSVEVLNWGLQGWSTLDEFNFFKQHSKQYGIDMVVIGWVDNDPDVGKIPQDFQTDAKKIHPVLYFISPALAQSKLNEHNNANGKRWNDAIYGEPNLKDYQVVLNQFHQYLDTNHIKSLMVMTTSGFGGGLAEHFIKAKPLITKAGFDCLDLYPVCEKKYGNYPMDSLHANPVNAHPGEILTEEFSNDVLDYLEQNHYMDSLVKVKK